MPIFDDIISAAAAPLTFAGSMGAAALQRKWALKDLAAQNLYNSPKMQVQRNTEAGLPLAAMFGGGVTQQSEQPRATNVDPNLGVARGIEAYQNNRMNQKQLELLDAQIKKTDAEGDEAKGRAQWLGKQSIDSATDEGINETNQEYGMRLKNEQEKFNTIIKGNDQLLSNLDTDIKSQLGSDGSLKAAFMADLNKKLQETLNLSQVHNINALLENINAKILKSVNDSPSGFTGLKAILMSALRSAGAFK